MLYEMDKKNKVQKGGGDRKDKKEKEKRKESKISI